MVFGGDELAVRTNLLTATPGWARVTGLAAGDGLAVTRTGGVATFRGSIEASPGRQLQFTQVVRDLGSKTRIEVEFAAAVDLSLEGVFFRIDLPRVEFAGGRVESVESGRGALLPVPGSPQTSYFGGDMRDLRATDAAGNVTWSAAFDTAWRVDVQDKAQETPQAFAVWVYVHRGNLAAGVRKSFWLEMEVAGQPETTTANLRLDAAATRYRFDGFGGNYCFNIESPVTQYTLDTLRVAFARTEMTLAEWEPRNENGSPEEMDWSVFAAADRPGSNLRREFELARQIQQRGIPYAISIWRLPEWLYTDPNQRGPNEQQRRVDPAMWRELLESIGSYLLYARDAYGVEPDWFSFNEADLGVYVLFRAEEHRDAIKSIGAHLAGLGLKTKMLLGDTAHPRGTHVYALPAAADPEAMAHVGALSFHSWGGATAAQYAAWGNLAERLGIPLFVGELGLAADAWRGQAYNTFRYGLNEVKMMQEILLYARPRGTMYWEWTSDYSLVEVSGSRITPTPRYWFTKQLANLTPERAEALGTASDHAKVLFTAFRGEPGYALHLVNIGAAREVIVEGMPPAEEVAAWRVVRTGEVDEMAEQAEVTVVDGVLRLQVPARTLVTLIGR